AQILDVSLINQIVADQFAGDQLREWDRPDAQLASLPQDNFSCWVGFWETKPRRGNPFDVVGLSMFLRVDWQPRFLGRALEIRKVHPRVGTGDVEVQAAPIRLI